jgi:integrase
VIEELKKHKALQNKQKLLLGSAYRDNDLVFPAENGKPRDPKGFLEHFQRLLQKAGLPKLRFHDLRHTHATLLLLLGEHPKVVQERLGHSTIAVTLDTYSHVLPSLQQKATEKIDKLFKELK